jgi:hypothetical protein
MVFAGKPVDFDNLTGYRRQAVADLDEAVHRLSSMMDGRHEAPIKSGGSARQVCALRSDPPNGS